MIVQALRNVRSISKDQASAWREWFTILLDLAKIRISLLATLTTATGYLLATGKITIHMLVPTAAVFLLACGSCALNQYQDREIDQLMKRTKSRPIPSGRLNPEAALWISMALILSGSLILFYGTEVPALALGLFAVLWYNLIYTILKRKTAFAAVPGALVGAIPAILGWMSGGSSMLDPRILRLALFFFIWQVPHFWLLLLDLSKDYEKAGLPSITQLFSTQQIKRIVFIWLLSTGVAGLSFPSSGLINFHFVQLFLFAATSWFIWNAIDFFRFNPQGTGLRIVFTKLNIYALFVLFLLSVDRLLSS
jgi:protoheme IX farnesyltransferase